MDFLWIIQRGIYSRGLDFFFFFFLNLLLSFLPGLFIFLCIITGALN